MQCSHAYRIARSKYIFCDFEGTPTGTSNSAIAPYLCIYQDFPPEFGGNIDNIPGWQNCPKLQSSESHEKTVLVSDWVADGTYTDYPYCAALGLIVTAITLTLLVTVRKILHAVDPMKEAV